MADRQPAVVGTAPAFCHGGGIFKRLNILEGEHGSALALQVAFPGDQSRAERSHDPGNIRAYCLAACNLFKAPEHCVVIKCPSLHNNMTAKFGGVRNLNNLKQGVFNYRVGKAGRDIGNFRPFFLRLFYFGIHKYSTPRSQVNGIVGKQSFMCEILHGIV